MRDWVYVPEEFIVLTYYRRVSVQAASFKGA